MIMLALYMEKGKKPCQYILMGKPISPFKENERGGCNILQCQNKFRMNEIFKCSNYIQIKSFVILR